MLSATKMWFYTGHRSPITLKHCVVRGNPRLVEFRTLVSRCRNNGRRVTSMDSMWALSDVE